LQNPAGTANLRSIEFAIGYYLPYFTKELGSQSIMIAIPFNIGVVSVGLDHFGFSQYQENTMDFNYARNITANLSAAFQISFISNHVPQSSSGYQVYSGLGLHYHPNKTIILGFYLSNPEKSTLTVQNEDAQIPSVYVLGFRWKASEYIIFFGEIEKKLEFKSLIKFGLEYNISNLISIRSGVIGKPINYTFGFGFKLHRIKLDAALTHHPILGMSSNIGFSFQFDRKK